MRLRDLLHRRRTTTHPAPAPHGVLVGLYPRGDSWRSPLCQTDDPAEHARCGHPANRARFDGCSCPCHEVTSYDDGGAA